MHNSNYKTVVIGLSGGVDSSVSAHLLLEQGYKVIGLFMKNWEEDDTRSYCAAEQDRADAQKVCDKLGIQLHTINFAYEYWERVFELFLSEYAAGRTPNPDVLCNREIKFKEFVDYAEKLGADAIATGHYVRSARNGTQTQLLRGKDINKDQSYFLHAVRSEALDKTLFPLGEIKKTQVRKIAHRLKLATFDKKDSTGICFIGERKFKAFLSAYLKPNPGDIVSVEGKLLGKHDGLMYYTLGQRQGLGIGGWGEPWYVAYKEIKTNILYVAQGQQHPALFSQTALVKDIHWINPVAQQFSCSAKSRYRQSDQACHVFALKDGEGVEVKFAQTQRAVTPGQSMVFYQNEVCLGGGVIHSTDQLLHYTHQS